MNIVLVGGMTRLAENYQQTARQCGMQLQIVGVDGQQLRTRIRQAAAVVVFTNMVSHRARQKAVHEAKRQGIPVFMHHSCGVCSLRECLRCLEIIGGTAAVGHREGGETVVAD